MEKGSFQNDFSDLSGLDFREELPPIPRVAPMQANVSSAQKKSSTVEALLAQNEDLMARLKVNLRRLTQLENENDELRDNEHHYRTQSQSLADQLLVWKEKESFWQQKNLKLEQDMTSLRGRFPELEAMEDKIARFEKYHEKVRTQVKPYIQQLKAFAENLTVEIRKLHQEIEEKEMRRQESDRRLGQIRSDTDEQLRTQNEQHRHLVQIFEEEKDRLHGELSELRKWNAVLEIKAEKLEVALLRIDELENAVIAIRRAKDENDLESRASILELSQQLQELKRERLDLNCRIENQAAKMTAAQEEAKKESSRAQQMEEQLTSLRYLWSNKCEELEKAQLQVHSLEKLNHELSHRLNQARKGEASL